MFRGSGLERHLLKSLYVQKMVFGLWTKSSIYELKYLLTTRSWIWRLWVFSDVGQIPEAGRLLAGKLCSSGTRQSKERKTDRFDSSGGPVGLRGPLPPFTGLGPVIRDSLAPLKTPLLRCLGTRCLQAWRSQEMKPLGNCLPGFFASWVA